MRPHDARAHLLDCAAACDRAQRFLRGHTFAEYEGDELLSSAVERQLEIVGEALNRASRVDPQLAELIPDLPRIIGLRNILAHGYDRVSAALIWDVVHTSLPELAPAIRVLLATE